MQPNQLLDESMITSQAREVGAEDLAAELTEAAFSVALQRGIGANWLDRKLDLWNAMRQTVYGWQFPAML